MKTCQKCGIQLDDTARFCSNCGTTLNSTGQEDFFKQAPVILNEEHNTQEEDKPASNDAKEIKDDSTDIQPVMEAEPADSQPEIEADSIYTPSQNTVISDDYAVSAASAESINRTSPCEEFSEIERTNRIIDTVGSSFSSPVFVITLICFSITAIAGMLVSFLPVSSNVFSTLSGMYGSVLSDTDIAYIISIIDKCNLISGLISVVPSIFAIIGLFMLFASRFDRPVITKGYGFIKAFAIIKLVLTTVIYGGLTVLLFIGANYVNSLPLDQIFEMISKSSTDMYLNANDNQIAGLFSSMIFSTIIYVTAGILILMLILYIFYYVKMIRSVTVMKKAGCEGKLERLPSGFVGVMSIIFGAFSSFGVLVPGTNVITSILGIAEVTMLIGFGVYMLALRRNLKQLFVKNQK